jgi:protein disulfide-isomerase A6
MKISLAYEVLMNAAKREIYDRYGEEGLKNPWMYNAEEIYDNYFGQKQPRFKPVADLLYSDSSVIELSESTSASFYNRKDIWLVQFYGPRSLTCRELSGDWKALGKRMENLVKVAAVNCEEVPDMCREFNVRKYPLIVFFNENPQQDPEIYSGPKNFRSLFEFIQGKIRNFLRPVTSRDYQDFLNSNNQLSKIISFTNTKENLPLIRNLCKKYKGRVFFAEAKASDTSLVSLFGLKTFPALVRVNTEGFEVFEGEIENYSVQNWINQKVGQELVKVLAIELNRPLFNVGNCNENDAFTCLIATDPDEDEVKALNEVADKFVNDQVKVFWILSEKFPEAAAKVGKIAVVKGKKKKIIRIQCQVKDFQCVEEKVTEILAGGVEEENFEQLFFADVKSDL